MATPISKMTANGSPRRYFMRLAYCGAPFHGWQEQPGQTTVQSVIEDAFSTLLREHVKIVGAGRTDTGVNARTMIAHFDTDASFDASTLPRRLNAMVGRDIAVYAVWEVDPDLHARFSATSRTYRYYASLRKNPFDYRLTWQAPADLDFEAMNRAARLLLETSDFTSFAKLHTDTRTNICRVDRAEWVRDSDTLWHFEIRADRFLRNMVRAVVGTLVEVGRKKLTVDGFRRIIDCRDRCAAGTSMPAQALFLWDVSYPESAAEPSGSESPEECRG